MTTVRGLDGPFPEAVIYEDLEVGGELSLSFGGRRVSVRPNDEEGALIAALLRPGSGLEAGDFVPPTCRCS